LLKLFKIWFLPLTLVWFLATMALLSNNQALDVYTSLFNLLSVDPSWDLKNSITISNAGHVLGFFSLAILCRISTPLRFWQIALLCIALAASLELTQKLLAYRQGRWDDLLFGVTGTCGGIWVVSFWAKTERGARDEAREEA
jgi:VanZ family protein